MLKVNTVLEFLDVGHNRLRNKGLVAITEGLTSNPNSNVKHLGIRYNFIKDEGIGNFFEEAIIDGNSKIKHVYMI
jgi:Ran GTPase-activating protein (RanGAP) involved in mRNA processing and transport